MSDDNHIRAGGEKTNVGISIAPLAALIFGHAVADGCINFIPAMWPVFQEQLGLTASQIGKLTGAVSVTTNFGQPLFGYLADRWRVPRMEAFGPIIVGLFVGLMGQTETLWLFGLLYVMAGIGTAMFHPEGATLAARVSGSALGCAAAGPVAVYLYQRLDMTGMMGATVIGAAAGILLLTVKVGRRYNDQNHEPLRLRRDVLPHLHRVSTLFAVVTLRAIVIVAFVTFIALQVKSWGGGLEVGARVLFLMIFCGGLGNILGGFLSDHIGRRAITVVSLIACAPFLVAFIHYGLPMGYALAAIAGFLAQMSVSVNIVQAQELLPAGPGIASSLTMGASWGVAGLSMPVVGWAADTYGLAATLMWLPALMVVAGALAIAIPDKAGEAVDRAGA